MHPELQRAKTGFHNEGFTDNDSNKFSTPAKNCLELLFYVSFKPKCFFTNTDIMLLSTHCTVTGDECFDQYHLFTIVTTC